MPMQRIDGFAQWCFITINDKPATTVKVISLSITHNYNLYYGNIDFHDVIDVFAFTRGTH